MIQLIAVNAWNCTDCGHNWMIRVKRAEQVGGLRPKRCPKCGKSASGKTRGNPNFSGSKKSVEESTDVAIANSPQ